MFHDIIFNTVPEPINDKYKILVMERYYGQGKRGADLNISYEFSVPKTAVSFQKVNGGYIMDISSEGLYPLAEKLVECQPDDCEIYPVFGV